MAEYKPIELEEKPIYVPKAEIEDVYIVPTNVPPKEKISDKEKDILARIVKNAKVSEYILNVETQGGGE